jgi:hypothetical protein
MTLIPYVYNNYCTRWIENTSQGRVNGSEGTTKGQGLLECHGAQVAPAGCLSRGDQQAQILSWKDWVRLGHCGFNLFMLTDMSSPKTKVLPSIDTPIIRRVERMSITWSIVSSNKFSNTCCGFHLCITLDTPVNRSLIAQVFNRLSSSILRHQASFKMHSQHNWPTTQHWHWTKSLLFNDATNGAAQFFVVSLGMRSSGGRNCPLLLIWHQSDHSNFVIWCVRIRKICMWGKRFRVCHGILNFGKNWSCGRNVPKTW